MIKTAQIVGKPSLLTKRNLIIFAIIVFVLITILTSIRVVGTGQVGVVTQYGASDRAGTE